MKNRYLVRNSEFAALLQIGNATCNSSVLIVLICGLRLLFAKRISPAVKIPSPWSIFNYLPELSLSTVQETRNDEPGESTRLTENMVSDLFSGVTDSEATTLPAEFEYRIRHEASQPERALLSSGLFALGMTATLWLLGCVGMALLFLRQWIVCRRWLSKAVPMNVNDGRSKHFTRLLLF